MKEHLLAHMVLTIQNNILVYIKEYINKTGTEHSQVHIQQTSKKHIQVNIQRLMLVTMIEHIVVNIQLTI